MCNFRKLCDIQYLYVWSLPHEKRKKSLPLHDMQRQNIFEGTKKNFREKTKTFCKVQSKRRMLPPPPAELRIRGILARIRINGSVPLTNGSRSGSGSCYFRHSPSKTQMFVCLLLFEGTYTSFFKDKKSSRSRKRLGIKAFLSIFAWW